MSANILSKKGSDPHPSFLLFLLALLIGTDNETPALLNDHLLILVN